MQIKARAADLLRFKFQRMVVSPFQRCLETAKELNSILDLPLSHLQVDRAVCEASARHEFHKLLLSAACEQSSSILLLLLQPHTTKHNRIVTELPLMLRYRHACSSQRNANAIAVAWNISYKASSIHFLRVRKHVVHIMVCLHV